MSPPELEESLSALELELLDEELLELESELDELLSDGSLEEESGSSGSSLPEESSLQLPVG